MLFGSPHLRYFVLSFTLDVACAMPTLAQVFPVTNHLGGLRDVVVEHNGGNVTIVNPDTQSPVPQGSASDGSGSGFDIPAILWIAFTLIVGSFMAFFGLRGWRITISVTMGLVLLVCSWAAIINNISSAGLNDLVLVVTVFCFFALGMVLGIFRTFQFVGLAALGISGGLSLGIRMALLRQGLLVHTFFVNWLIAAVLGTLGLCAVLFKQRAGIASGCALTGTFLLVIGVDLIVHQQNIVSLGLRILFDQNSAHLADLVMAEYNPSASTQAMLGVSIALAPVFAYAQHRIFPQPFDRSSLPSSASESDLSALYPETTAMERYQPGSRFSM